ncbi:hypothetical protein C8A03DRAFT_13522 [Achaetomium macrosporum]|uniref:WSC domain-containing protein n=1 Tax=Achaetomium macrosporum TaxID=79813 RepID=A0AAN7H8K6_9PEZI|nr:hypothetical protein C8A03DRAFT_13522 [Achaetomium macrosporum]
MPDLSSVDPSLLTDNRSVYGNCDPATQRCCGVNEFHPVYINPELQGWYTPLIPGFKQSIDDAVYECAVIPEDLTGPPTTLSRPTYNESQSLQAALALIWPPTVEAPGATYHLWGCSNAPPEDIFHTHVISPGGGLITLDLCAFQCQQSTYRDSFAVINGTDCFCGTEVDARTTAVDMSYCNVPCIGDETIACGGDPSFLVYSAAQGGVYPESQARPPQKRPQLWGLRQPAPQPQTFLQRVPPQRRPRPPPTSPQLAPRARPQHPAPGPASRGQPRPEPGRRTQRAPPRQPQPQPQPPRQRPQPSQPPAPPPQTTRPAPAPSPATSTSPRHGRSPPSSPSRPTLRARRPVTRRGLAAVGTGARVPALTLSPRVVVISRSVELADLRSVLRRNERGRRWWWRRG